MNVRIINHFLKPAVLVRIENNRMPGFQQASALLRRGLPAPKMGGFFFGTLASCRARLHNSRVASPKAGPGRLQIGPTCLFSSSGTTVRPSVSNGIPPPEKIKYKGEAGPAPDQCGEYSKYLNAPIPDHIHPYLPAIEAYVVDTWLPSFPLGARLKKLQRDITFLECRVIKSTPTH
jgi:hypothetical protein